MEYYTVVVTSAREFCKIFACLKLMNGFQFRQVVGVKVETYSRCMIPVQFHLDIPQTGL